MAPVAALCLSLALAAGAAAEAHTGRRAQLAQLDWGQVADVKHGDLSAAERRKLEMITLTATGQWVVDEERKAALDYSSSCPIVDERQTCADHLGPDCPPAKYAWRPGGRKAPLFFNATAFTALPWKGIFFAGDSLVRNQFQSLACLLHHLVPGSRLRTPQLLELPDRERRVRLTTDSVLVAMLDDQKRYIDHFRDPPSAKPLYVDMNRPGPFVKGLTREFDVLVVSSGRHQAGHPIYTVSEDNGTLRREVVPPTLAMYQGMRIFLQTVKASGWNGTIVWRTFDASHFYGGEWDTGGGCNVDGPSKSMSTSQLGDQVDSIFLPLADAAGFEILRLSPSGLRPDAHPGSGNKAVSGRPTVFDCVHYALPGVPDMFNELLYELLRSVYEEDP